MRRCLIPLFAGFAIHGSASAQTFTIDFNDLPLGSTLSNQYQSSMGVNFIANAFVGPNNNNTEEPWATNTGLTITHSDGTPANPGYALGTPTLFSGNFVRSLADYNNEDGDASVMTTFATPITSATVTFIGIYFFEEAARDTSLLALDANNNVLAVARAVGTGVTSQQNLTVNVPAGFSRLAILPGNYFDTVGFDNLVYTVGGGPLTPEWGVDADGNFATASNWAGGTVPSGPAAMARFGSTITQPRTVTVTSTATLNQIVFANANPYTLVTTNGSSIQLTGTNPGIVAESGAHVMQLPVLSDSDLAKSGSGTVSFQKVAATGALKVNEGAVKLIGSATTVSRANQLTVDAGASLDVGSAALVLQSTTAVDARTLLAQSRVLTSAAGRAVGYAVGNSLSFTTLGGEDVSGTRLLLRSTIAGDTDLDLDVDFADLLSLAQNYNASGSPDKVWRQGDFDYNGIVNFADLLAIAQRYGSNASLAAADLDAMGYATFANDFTLAMAMVPEPTAAIGLIGVMHARRKRLCATDIYIIREPRFLSRKRRFYRRE